MPKKSYFHPRLPPPKRESTTSTTNGGITPPLKGFHKHVACLIFLGSFLGFANLYHQELRPVLEMTRSVVVEMATTTTTTSYSSRNVTTTTAVAGGRDGVDSVRRESTTKETTETETETTETTEAKEKDPCGLLSPQPSINTDDGTNTGTIQTLQNQLKWIPYTQTPPSQQEYFRQVYTCSKQFNDAYVHDGLDPTTFVYTDSQIFGSGSRVLQSFVQQQCNSNHNGKNNTTTTTIITQQRIQQLVSQRKNILFAGDSVLRQQYLVFVCMIDPLVTEASFQVFEQGGNGGPYHYNYRHFSGGASTIRTTSVRFEAIGRVWNADMYQLWHGAFPRAVTDFQQGDIIVMDSSRHFNTLDIREYQQVLQFIQSKAIESKATIYYMEPTPQEWPTSNGLPLKACFWKCQCQLLTDLALQGMARPYDTQVNLTSVETHSGRTNITQLNHNHGLYESFAHLYGQGRAHTFTIQAKQQQADATAATCLPDCVPATWRVDLVRSILLSNSNNNNHLPPSLSSSSSSTLQLVPIYWQLLGRSQHSSVLMRGDCTHRSIDAIVFMNEQLIRSMMIANANQ